MIRMADSVEGESEAPAAPQAQGSKEGLTLMHFAIAGAIGLLLFY